MPARRKSFENPDFADWFVSGVGVLAAEVGNFKMV
jgi:hypothetical protein